MISFEKEVTKNIIFQLGVLFTIFAVYIHAQHNRNTRLNDVIMVAKRQAVLSCQDCKINKLQCLQNENMKSPKDKFRCLQMCNGRCKLLDQATRSLERQIRKNFHRRRNIISLIDKLAGYVTNDS